MHQRRYAVDRATVDEDSEGLEEVEGDIEKVDGVVVAEQAIGE